MCSNFFFQAKKKEAKKSLATTTATVSQTPQRSFGMRENKRLFSHCRDFRPRLSVIFFFQAKKKEAKKSPGHLRLCPGLKAPGRNYKLLPALATNSPPDCLLNASRPQRFKVSVKLRCVAPATPFLERIEKNNNLIS